MAALRDRLSLRVLTACLLGSVLAAQMRWVERVLPTYYGSTFVYDPVRNRMVVFGNTTFRQTIEYDYSNWRLAASTSPMRLEVSGAAFDPSTAKVVCLDGSGPQHTWTWDGVSWTTYPESFDFYAEHFVSHKGRHRVVAMGGFGATIQDYTPFEWVGSSWRQIQTPPGPPRFGPMGLRRYLGAVYDERRDKYVLFGHATYDQFNYFDLAPVVWEWDAQTGWLQRQVAFPAVLNPWDPFVWMQFDSTRGVIMAILRTGDRAALGFQSLEWDGGPSWRNVSHLDPPPRNTSWNTMTPGFDEKRGIWHIMMRRDGQFHGYLFQSVRPAEFAVHRPGCPGSAGQSELRLLRPWTRAWLGQALDVELTNLPTSSAIVVVGCEDRTWGALTLPIPLDPIGMPGCALQIAPDAIYAIAGANQRASLSMAVPLHASLLGVELFEQGFAIDPSFNALGLTASNSIRATIGR